MKRPQGLGQLTSALILVLVLVLITAAYELASRKAADDLRQTGGRQLQIIALDLDSVLERYDTLPYSVAHLSLAAQLLANPNQPAKVDELNAVLQDLQRQAKVAAIYLMDPNGKTLASSNWDTALSFVGQNFSFRPYFADAIRGQPGFFYAIGSTTNTPGYFISQPVYPLGAKRGTVAPVGVIAVKISLDALEQTWRSNDDPIALVDTQGVIFLSNRRDWRYHSLGVLDRAVQANIEHTQQYLGQRIQPLANLPRASRGDLGEAVARPVGRLGWQLMLFPAQAKILRAGLQAAGLTVLLLVLAAAVAAVYHQRRRRLEERHSAQLALTRAAEELELKIAQRTHTLQSANAELEAKYDKLQQADQLLRSTQNEMVQTGKLAMLGQMATGITHELNQPLTAIRAFADNAATFLSRGKVEQAQENLRHISDASARMGSIIGQLKGFARKSPQAVTVVDVNQAIHAAALLLHSEFTRLGVPLSLDLPQVLQVQGDPVRVEQVLINLLRNALDAVTDAPDKQVQLRLEADATQVIVRVRDSGSGLSDEVLRHLFEPFFTTKALGQGLGLGLAISSSIVQAMNGRLEANKLSPCGAEFVLTLPRYLEPSA